MTLANERVLLQQLAAAAATRAAQAAPIPQFRAGTCAGLGPPTPDGEVPVVVDGDDTFSWAQVVGGFLPQLGDRVWCLINPPHAVVILGRVGATGGNGTYEDWQGFGGSSPTDALTAAAFTTWPVIASTTVSIPIWAKRMIAESFVMGAEQTASSGVFEVQQVTAAGSGAVYRYSAGNGGNRSSIIAIDEYDVTLYAGGIISARLDGRRPSGAGALNYDSFCRARWLFRFYES